MTKAEVIALLHKAVLKAGSQRAWAEAQGLSGAYVSDVLAGKREPGKSILDALGITSETVYRKA